MASDTRHFDVDTAGDDDRLWAVLRALASAAHRIAREKDWTCVDEVRVSHTTGDFHRPSVDAARATAEDNGFLVTGARCVVYRPWPGHPPEDTLDWVMADANPARANVHVEVWNGGTELEVNGTYTQLHQAADGVPWPAPEPVAPESAAPPEPPEPQPWWRRALGVLTTHPLVVTVVGGLMVLALATWLGLSD